MTISEAKSFIGLEVTLTWCDRKGEQMEQLTRVYSADFVPLYGPCLVTDAGDIRLDRIVQCLFADRKKIA